MQEVTLKVYSFSELTEPVQKKLIEKNRDIAVFDRWYEDVYEQFREKLAEDGFSDLDMKFSGFWSQGDGASIVPGHVDLKKFIGDTRRGSLLEALETERCIEVSFSRNTSHHCHENTIVVYINILAINEKYKRLLKLLDLDGLEAELRSYLKSQSKELYKALEECHEQLTSDEQVLDYLINSDTLYFEDGRIY